MRMLETLALACAAALVGGVSAEAALLDLTGVSVAGGTVGASSTEFGPENPREAFDQNPGLRWASGSQTADPDPQWLWVDLGQDYTLDQVLIAWETAHAGSYTLRVRTSAQGFVNPDVDLAGWTTIASIAGRTGGGDGSGSSANDDFNFETATFTALTGAATSSTVAVDPVGRFLLIHSTARATPWGNSIWETQVFASPVPEPGSLALLAAAGLLVARRR